MQTTILQIDVMQLTEHDGNLKDATWGDTIPLTKKNLGPT